MFDAIAPSYDRSGVPFFGTIASGLVDLLAPRPGERALDVGAGRGAVTLRLAESVGARGRVDAIDVSPGHGRPPLGRGLPAPPRAGRARRRRPTRGSGTRRTTWWRPPSCCSSCPTRSWRSPGGRGCSPRAGGSARRRSSRGCRPGSRSRTSSRSTPNRGPGPAPPPCRRCTPTTRPSRASSGPPVSWTCGPRWRPTRSRSPTSSSGGSGPWGRRCAGCGCGCPKRPTRRSWRGSPASWRRPAGSLEVGIRYTLGVAPPA